MNDALNKWAADLGLSLSATENYVSVRRGQEEVRISHAHGVYLQNIIPDFEYWHTTVMPENIDGVAVSDYSQSRVHRLSRTGIEFEFPSLPESDETTDAYMEALDPRPGDVIFDLGAYAGASSYFFAKEVGPEGMVVSFEPDLVNFLCLERNVARHGLQNVKAVNKGAWSESTTLSFQAEGNMGSSPASFHARDTNVRQVEVLSLKDAVAAFCPGKRVAGIKIDIEGSEVAVLEGSADFLRRHRPALIVEPHVIQGEMNASKVMNTLLGYGYAIRLLPQGVHGYPLIAAHFVPSRARRHRAEEKA